ncbi:hypothetical protein BHY_1012 (plasmid) [Borrelia nietonii YOR]|uniref:Uncharacterized protein n=1 Tax=Borrelia nietonii YOR TaxID=1293576 RepID=W5SB88_9SPIR|nr:hypothetical protein BHY_1012 [Borrelia nietonii YOR]
MHELLACRVKFIALLINKDKLRKVEVNQRAQYKIINSVNK